MLVLIAGGDGKGADFSELAEAVEGKLRGAVLIGEDAEKIAHALDTVMPVHFAENMDSAVHMAATCAESEDTVLLAPACASFDQYDNYMARGDAFCGGGAAAMTAGTRLMPFPARLRTELQIDPILLTIVLTLLLGGFVILASASISISDNAAGNPFFYVQRQLIAAVIGAVAGGVCLFIPMRVWQNLGPLMLFAGMALLIVVLVPGIGYEVNGSTRWVRIGIMNLQVSEPARLFFLMYLAGYLVRRNKALREPQQGAARRVHGFPAADGGVDHSLRTAAQGAGLRCGNRIAGYGFDDALRCGCTHP
jgi:hypothetical protein